MTFSFMRELVRTLGKRGSTPSSQIATEPPRDMPQDRPERCIMILGMHRSGTSALAGSFREAGLYMGNVLDQGFGLNPKGLQEPSALVYMHENLLEANGGAWHAPPDTITWEPLHKSVRALFIESRIGKGTWGFKEPRSLLVAQDWIEVLPDWSAVGIFRDPCEVGLSLQGRNGFELEKCFQIWGTYNQKLLDLHEQYGVPIMEFLPDGEKMQQGIARLIAHTGLIPPDQPAFFDAKIPRNTGKAQDLEMPAETARLLARLREIASQP